MKRGSELPQSKLTEHDVKLILDCVAERERLRDEANKLSNQALAEKFDLHIRTIEKITSRRSWIHV